VTTKGYCHIRNQRPHNLDHWRLFRKLREHELKMNWLKEQEDREIKARGLALTIVA